VPWVAVHKRLCGIDLPRVPSMHRIRLTPPSLLPSVLERLSLLHELRKAHAERPL
jgi:hypothetical protein